jgi:superfamily I DNA/RNA helicase
VRPKLKSPESLCVVKGLADGFVAAGKRGEDGSKEPAKDTVWVSTVHKAKGLEWPLVAVADFTYTQFPFDRYPLATRWDRQVINKRGGEQ